jgi:ketosteroid isomerase-like protein
MVTLRLLAACAVVAALSGCAAHGARSRATDEAAIAAFNARYLKALNDEDIVTLSSLTTDDHIMIAPNRAPTVGKKANDDANARAFQRFDIDETWTPLETVISGDLAYQRGTFTVNATPKAGGNAIHTSGHFLRIYRRQPDGSWRMVRGMFNSDQPARPPSAPQP